MNYLLAVLLFIFCCTTFGYAFNVLTKLNRHTSALIGFCIIALLTYNLYHYFSFSIDYIFNSIIFILLINLCILFFTKKIKYLLKLFLKNLICILPINIFFLGLFLFYDFNFFVFRGNLWDTAFYLEHSLIFSNIPSNELETFKEYLGFKFHIIRTLPSLLIALTRNLGYFNIIESQFILKIVSLSLSAIAVNSFLEKFTKENKIFKLVFASLFPFTFFVFYIFETDAFAQLLSIPICIMLLILTYDLLEKIREDNFNFFHEYLIVVSTIYVLYFEVLGFYCFLSLIFFLYYEKLFKFNKIHLLKYSLFFIIIFFFYTNPLLNINYVIPLIKGNLNIVPETGWNNYWGYYGAFLSGKESIIINREIAHEIKNNIGAHLDINHFLDILKINHHSGYKLQLLNILPSSFGFWHLTVGKVENFLSLSLIYLLIINLLIAYILIANLKKIIFIRTKINNLVLSSLIAFMVILLYLLFKGNYWQAIKLFFFNNFIFFILISLKFTTKEYIKIKLLSIIIIIIMCFLPFYVYSEYNNGNGRLTTFPSSLHPKLKKEFYWNFYENVTNECKNFLFKKKAKDRYDPNFHQERYLKIFVEDIKIKNRNGRDCIVKIDNKYLIEK